MPNQIPGFIGGRGFQITFSNGYTVSVMWHGFSITNRKPLDQVNPTAEVAVFDPKDNWILLPDFGWPEGEKVVGYRTPEEVARIISHVSTMPKWIGT